MLCVNGQSFSFGGANAPTKSAALDAYHPINEDVLGHSNPVLHGCWTILGNILD